MVETEALFHIGDAAEEAGNFAHALKSFEQGAALGHAECISRLAHLFDTGVGVETDKAKAMHLYQRAWRRGSHVASLNIALLYQERQNYRAMFQWWKRAADHGDGGGLLEMARCYTSGTGVRKDLQAALRCLAAAVRSTYITEHDRDEAKALQDILRPRQV